MKYGSAIVPDSINYLDTAKNIIAGNGVVLSDGKPFILYAPLYPLVIAATALLTGTSVLFSAQLLSYIFHFLLIIVFDRLCKMYIGYNVVSVLTLVYFSLSNLLLETSSSLLTESFSVLLICWSIVFYRNYDKGSNKYFYYLAAFSALGAMLRYALVVNIIIFGILIVMDNKKHNRLWNAFKYFIMASLPPALWLYRNYLIAGSFTGTRGAAKLNIIHNISQLIHSIFWMISFDLQGAAGCVFGYVFIAAFFYLIIINGKVIFGNLHLYSGQKEIFIFIGLYVMFLIATSSMFAYDTISARLLLPIYIPAVIIFAVFVKSKEVYKIPVIRYLGIAYLLTSLIITGFITYSKSIDGAGGYSSRIWQESEMLSYSSNVMLQKANIYSNVPELLSFYKGIKAANLPQKFYYNSTTIFPDSKKEMDAFKNGKGYLFWFYNNERGFLHSLKELRNYSKLDTVKVFSDGIIYKIN
jgi:hypothetical protein